MHTFYGFVQFMRYKSWTYKLARGSFMTLHILYLLLQNRVSTSRLYEYIWE